MPRSSNDSAYERREPAPRWQAWLETAGLALAALAMGALLEARDPLLSCRALPWLALAPMLAGLRYGAGHGVACGAALVLALELGWAWGTAPAPGSAPSAALGWLAAGLTSGKFRDAWMRRARRLQAHADELHSRLEALARAHHALKLSHDRLQRAAPGSPSCLRDALDGLRRELRSRRRAAEPAAEPIDALGGRILAFLGEHAAVRAATLHLVTPCGRPGPAVATMGAVAAVRDDPLVALASTLGEVVSVRDVHARSHVLAAVPLVDVDGRVHAVVAVHDMPFLSLHAETLALLAVLGGQLGDVLSRAMAPTGGARSAARPWRAQPVAETDVPGRRHGVGA